MKREGAGIPGYLVPDGYHDQSQALCRLWLRLSGKNSRAQIVGDVAQDMFVINDPHHKLTSSARGLLDMISAVS